VNLVVVISQPVWPDATDPGMFTTLIVLALTIPPNEHVTVEQVDWKQQWVGGDCWYGSYCRSMYLVEVLETDPHEFPKIWRTIAVFHKAKLDAWENKCDEYEQPLSIHEVLYWFGDFESTSKQEILRYILERHRSRRVGPILEEEIDR